MKTIPAWAETTFCDGYSNILAVNSVVSLDPFFSLTFCQIGSPWSNRFFSIEHVFPASFTSIDFETASRRPDSACQLGLVKIVDGLVVNEKCWLIRPKPFVFHPSNIQIHGITPDSVESAPNFSQLWDEIKECIGSSCLVAHNASFDLRVLLSTLRSHLLPIPELEYTCTRAIARKTWPHQKRFGLKPLSDWLGIRFQHHDALEDATACAKLLIAAGIDKESSSLSDLEKKLRLSRGRAGSWGMKGPASQQRKPTARNNQTDRENLLPFIKPNDLSGFSRGTLLRAATATNNHQHENLQRLIIRVEFIRPLANKKVVVAGPFTQHHETEISQLVSRSGAVLQQQPDENTDFLISDQSTLDLKASIKLSDCRVITANVLIDLLRSSSSAD